MTKRKNRKKRKQLANAPKLYKDLWVNKILPELDHHSLLEFSAASSETREIGLAELFKREGFARKLQQLKAADTSTPSILSFLASMPEHKLTKDEKELLNRQNLGTIIRVACFACFLVAAASNPTMLYDDLLLPLASLTDDPKPYIIAALTIAPLLPIYTGTPFTSPGSVADYEYQKISKENKLLGPMQHNFFGNGLKKKSAPTEKSLFRKFNDTSESEPAISLGCGIM